MANRNRVYTKIDSLRKYIDEMLLSQPDAAYRRNGYVHLYGVGMAAAIIALKRGFDPELAEMAGMLHDYICYQDYAKDGPTHAYDCEPVARSILNEMNITTKDETDLICSAIYNHSDKNKIHSDFDEILKDADVMQHWLRNPKEPLNTFYRDEGRVEKLCKEFGLIFSLCTE
jgi:HD superfamily phosphodiesterase